MAGKHTARTGNRLPQLVLAAGESAFPATLLNTARQAAGVDHCVVFRIDSPGSVRCLLNAGNISMAPCLEEAYGRQFHVADPNMDILFAHREDQAPFLLPPFERDMYDRIYRRLFFDRARIVDKFATAIWAEETCFYINFYRTDRGGAFAPHQAEELRQISPVLSATVLQHFRDSLQVPAGSPAASLQDIFCTARELQALTGREKAVCLDILRGYSSEAIAGRLGISIHSTITYRKRAYDKLRICSQNELFGVVLRLLTDPAASRDSNGRDSNGNGVPA